MISSSEQQMINEKPSHTLHWMIPSDAVHVGQVIINHHNAIVGSTNAQISQVSQSIGAQNAAIQALKETASGIESSHQAQSEERVNLFGNQMGKMFTQLKQLELLLKQIEVQKRISQGRFMMLDLQVYKLEEENKKLKKLYTELTSIMNELEEKK